MAESIFCFVVTSNVSGPFGGPAPCEASSLAMILTTCAPAAAITTPRCLVCVSLYADPLNRVAQFVRRCLMTFLGSCRDVVRSR
jgi:hypothetical protein